MLDRKILEKVKEKIIGQVPQQIEEKKIDTVQRHIIVSEPIITIGNRPEITRNRDKLIPELLRYLSEVRAFLKHIRRENLHDISSKQWASQVRQSLDETDDLLVDLVERQNNILNSDGLSFDDDYRVIHSPKNF